MPAIVVGAALVVVGVAFGLGSADTPPRTTASSSDLNSDLSPETAPDFTLSLMDGRTFSLASHLAEDGRPVLLNFWASWCIPCRREMPALDAAALRHPEVMFLGVAVEDDPSAARQFAAELGVSFPLAVDETGTMMVKYLVFGLPTTRIISGEGRIVMSAVGELAPEQIEEMLAGLDSSSVSG
ncbi:MAG: TlpA family protein disulfide reductase [Acidimicrobiia bacterium]